VACNFNLDGDPCKEDSGLSEMLMTIEDFRGGGGEEPGMCCGTVRSAHCLSSKTDLQCSLDTRFWNEGESVF
jgi:hypothetical protein